MIRRRLAVATLVALCNPAWLPVTAQEEEATRSERGVKLQEASDSDEHSSSPVLDRTPVLPPVDPASGQRLAAVSGLFVRNIRLKGNTVLDDEDVAVILQPFRNRQVSVEELHAARLQLSQLYFDRGYVNSGVIIPDQNVEDGEIVLQVIQGSLTRIDLDGNRHLRSSYLENQVRRDMAEPLQINELQQSLLLVQQNPMIRRINARLVPGDAPGQSHLELDVAENSPFVLVLTGDNYRPPSTGEQQLTLSFAHRSLTGHADVLSVYGRLADGMTDGAVSYDYPFNDDDFLFRSYYSVSNSQVVEEPFDSIDIESRVWTAGVGVSHSFLRRPGSTLAGHFGIEAKHSESTLLGFPFSFSPGEQDGEADTTTILTSLDWNRGGRKNGLAVRGTVRWGVDALEATINESGPDGEFVTLQAQFQYALRFRWLSSQLLARTSMQLASDPLLGMEKMPIGGATSVRGYPENRLVRDNGLVVSVEWRIPLFPNRPRTGKFQPMNLVVAPFADYGRGWDENERLLTNRTDEIYSAGLGALWSPVSGLSAEIWWGEPLEDELVSSGDSLQSNGIHFRVGYQIPL